MVPWQASRAIGTSTYGKGPGLSVVMRAYSGEPDYWRIRDFLRDVMLRHGVLERSWHVARLDYWRWHVALNCQHKTTIDDLVLLWETDDGRIAAVLNPEGDGDAHLQLDPDFESAELVGEMLAAAELHLAAEKDGVRRLSVWTGARDSLRQAALEARGYSRGKWAESQWRRDLVEDVPEIPAPAGYVVRSLGGPDELPARSWASWRGFHPNEPDQAYEGWEWYPNLQRCPLYRRDLDLVAAAPSGEIASFCTFWYDDVTRSAYVEPVATVPEHLRRGLARAVISEGLRRVRGMGATRAFVGGYEPGPNALYSSTLSPSHEVSEEWTKRW